MNVKPTPFSELTAIKKGKRIIVAVTGGTVLAAQGQKSSAKHEASKETGSGFDFPAGELLPRQGCGLAPQRHSFDAN
jgi:hypothetical protein